MTEKNVSRSGSWRVTAHALREQFIAENVLVYDGHAFQITQDFLAYIDTLVRNHVIQITVLDSSSIPCLIVDTTDFLKQLLAKHLEATNTLAMAWAARKNEL